MTISRGDCGYVGSDLLRELHCFFCFFDGAFDRFDALAEGVAEMAQAGATDKPNAAFQMTVGSRQL